MPRTPPRANNWALRLIGHTGTNVNPAALTLPITLRKGMQMSTRTDNAVALSPSELATVLDALNEAAKTNYKFWRNQRNQPATRAYAKQQADTAMLTRDALVRRMHTWTPNS